jgi:hypothetical protein
MGNFLPDGWWKFAGGHIAIPESLTPTFVKQFHEGTHSGQTALETTLAQHFCVPKLSSISKAVCEKCSLLTKTTPWKGQGCLSRYKALVELLLKTCLWTSLKYHGLEDGNIYWCLSAASQDAWKPFPGSLKRPRRWPDVC